MFYPIRFRFVGGSGSVFSALTPVLFLAMFLPVSGWANGGEPLFPALQIEELECVDFSSEFSESMSPAFAQAVCQDVTLSVDENGELFVLPEHVDGGSDLTGFQSWNVSPDEFDCSVIGTGAQMVTLTIIEVTGAQSSCMAGVTVVDSVSPVALCKDTVLYLLSDGMASLAHDDLDGGSSDNCTAQADLQFLLSRTMFNCADQAVTGSFSAYSSDQISGNQAYLGALGKDFDVNRSITITHLGAFDDDQDGILGNYNGNAVRVAIMDRATQSIVAGLDVEISGDADPLVGNHRMREVAPVVLMPGQYTVVAQGYHAMEQNGNTNIGGFPPTISDHGAGAISFPNISRYSANICCTFPYPTTIYAENNGFHAGTFSFEARVGTLVEMTVTDEFGNDSTCTAYVIVEDTIPPTMGCQDITVELDETGNAQLDTMVMAGTTNDACGIDTITLSRGSVNCSDIDQAQVWLYAEDVNGNVDSCEVVVTVLDPLPPTLECPQSDIIYLDTCHCDKVFCYSLLADDNCPGNVTSIAGFVYLGDLNGNHYFASTTPLSWEDANTSAAENGGHLLYINSAEEASWVRMNYTPGMMDPTIWLGARQSYDLDAFKWNDGAGLSYSEWATGAPGSGPFDRDFVYWEITGGASDGWYNIKDELVERQYIIELENGWAISLVSGIAPGNAFPYGQTNIVYEMQDAGGNRAQCMFTIDVQSNDNPACTEQHISVGEDCDTEVTPNMVLSPKVDCEELYNVQVFDKYGSPKMPGNIVGMQDLGQWLDYEVEHIDNGFKCWGRILIEDKFPPFFPQCEEELTFSCIEMVNYPGPAAMDNCGTPTVRMVKYLPEPLFCDANYVKKLHMGYVAEDAYGNVSDTCFQTIFIERLIPANITFEKENDIDTFYCAENYLKDGNGHPDPSVNGIPVALGAYPLWPYNDEFCNVTVRYEDEVEESSCETRITRRWDVTEWNCSQKIPLGRFVQQFLIIDTIGPTITLPDVMTVNTDRRNCSATFALPRATVMDACHEPSSVTVETPLESYPGMNGPVVTLPVGTHTVYYEAYDACYKKSVDSIIVTVVDNNPPVAICEQHVVVSLRQDGTATAEASVFDDGSYDPCGIDSIRVRRMTDSCGVPGNTSWGDEVSFCCADVDPSNYVMVALRIVDHGGKVAQCMVSVEVQDKLRPTLIPLPDMTISCEYPIDTTRLFEFGKIATSLAQRQPIIASNMQATFSGAALDGLASDNCEPIVDESFRLDVDQCGKGYLWRYFTITDGINPMIFDTQTIKIIDRDPFDRSDFEWPADLDTVGICNEKGYRPEDLPERYARPIITGDDACSKVGASYEDLNLPVTRQDTACFKILRKWTIVDWCQNPNGRYKRWEHEQILIFRNETPPVIDTLVCRDTSVCSYDKLCQEGLIELVAEGSDDCTPVDELFWSFRIDIDNDGTIDTTANSNDATGYYPVGTHRIWWFLEDRCGNIDTCDHLFTINNCTGPITYCRNGLIVNLTEMDFDNNGSIDDTMAIVLAEYLDDGSSHPCGYPLEFSFSLDSLVDTMSFRCPDVGDTLVQMWVIDPNGNYGSCMVTIQVTDSLSLCGMLPNPLVSVTGELKTFKGVHVAGADVKMHGTVLPPYHTDESGIYAFPGMATGGSYQIVPEKLDEVLDGVSTKDIIMIQRHLLGIETLTNPYALIAADVNNSRSVSAKDLTELKKTILGLQPTFPDNNSWRFVLADYQFPQADNPWVEQFPEFQDIGRLTADENIDFIGIKIGDVDESLSFGSGVTESRSNETSTLIIGAPMQTPDYGWVIPVSIKSTTAITGLQFQLDWKMNHMAVKGVIPVEKWISGQGIFNDQGLYTGKLSGIWTSSEPVQVNDELLFYLDLNDHANLDMLPVFELSASGISSESYDAELRTVPMGLTTREADTQALELGISPNPWADVLKVEIAGARRGQGSLMIFDQNGKQIWRREERIIQDGLETYIRRQSQWRAGMYHLVFVQGDQRITQTVILSE